MHLLEVVMVVTVLLWHINAAIPVNYNLLIDKLFIEGVFLLSIDSIVLGK